MQKYPLEKIAQLKKMRKRGLSISELMTAFSMPKTTIWHHIHGIKLPEKYIANIKSRQGGSKVRSQNDWDRADKHAKEILKSVNKYPYSLLAMLYWAEGNKRDFIFTNTEGAMIKLFLHILKNYFGVEEKRLKLTIRIFSNLNKKVCIKYWSNMTGLSKNKFIIYLNDGGIKGKAKYGICRITIKRGGYLHKLTFSLINNILQEMEIK